MAPAVAPATVAPVTRAERIEALDVLRGFALSGILFVNIETFSGHDYLSPAQAAALPGGSWDGVATFLVAWLIHAKFYSLFSLLFGLGFAVFMQRAAAKGASPAPLFKRRLTGLLIIGLAHSVLLWFGDILHVYAIFGFLLLLFRDASPRTILRWSLALLILPIALHGLFLAGALVTGAAAAAADGPRPAVLTRAIDAFHTGGPGELLRANALLTVVGFIVRRVVQMQAVRVLAMFLLGLYISRRGWLEQPPESPVLRRIVVWGLIVGLPTGAAAAVLPAPRLLPEPTVAAWLETTTESISALALCLAYASAIVLLLRTEGGRRLLAPLGAFGRMALTNYLMQTIICIAIFYGIGFGLFMTLGLPYVLAVAVAIVVVQVVVSRLWMACYPYGPAELAWRTFTYGSKPFRPARDRARRR